MVNDSQLYYSSEWDIDQLDDSGEVDSITLAGSTFSPTSVTLKTLSLSYPPVVDGAFQLTSDTVWRQFGDGSNVTLIQLETFLAVTSSAISLVYYNYNAGDITVNVRYYMWTDRIDES